MGLLKNVGIGKKIILKNINDWFYENAIEKVDCRMYEGKLYVWGSINISGNEKFTGFPYPIEHLFGNLMIWDCENLNSLNNFPKSISGSCCITECKSLKNMEGLGSVGQDLHFKSNGLTSLKGCQGYVNGDFDCSMNQLQSLEFGPAVVKLVYDCSSNNLKNLKYLGIAESVNCSFNKINTWEGFNAQIGYGLNISWNEDLKTLVGGPKDYIQISAKGCGIDKKECNRPGGYKIVI